MDQYGPGAALQMVAGLGAILTVIFRRPSGCTFRAKGGYRVIPISSTTNQRRQTAAT